MPSTAAVMWPGTELSDSTLSTKRFYFRQLHKIEQTPVFAVSETSSPSSAERGKPRRGRARGRGRGSGTGRLKRNAPVTDDGPCWHSVQPHHVMHTNPVIKTPNVIPPLVLSQPLLQEIKPRVWASNLTELLEILPALACNIQGISWESSDIPYLILDGPVWPGDSWSSSTCFDITMVRDFSYTKLDLDAKLASLLKQNSFRWHTVERTGQRNRPNLCDAFIGSQDLRQDLARITTAPNKELDIDLSLPSLISETATRPGPSLKRRIASSDLPSLIQSLPVRIGLHDHNNLRSEETSAYPSDKDEPRTSLLVPYVKYEVSGVRDAYLNATGASETAADPYLILHGGNAPLHKSHNTRLDLDARKYPNRVPADIPVELKTLVDAHNSGIPIAIIASHRSPLNPVPLSSEYGCSFLGLFFLVSFQQEDAGGLASDNTDLGRAHGRVKWHLKFQWAPGGEDLLPGGENLVTPWWAPTLTGDGSKCDARDKYMARDDLQDTCHNLLPLDILADQGSTSSGGLLPRGWYCVNCGKLNKQIHLRHRQCTSSACQPASGTVGYAEPLELAREHAQALVLVGPGNLAPKSIMYETTSWADGMHTYHYAISDKVAVTHIFTANIRSLQVEANLLFREVQVHVPLLRQPKGPGYFTSLVGGEDSGTLQWDRAPKCLVQARELMVHEARTYGEIENCTVGELVTFAWATTGKGKGPVLHAREGLVTILCLGADAAFTLTPKLDGVVPNTPLSEALPGDNDSMILFDSAVHAGLIESTRVDGAVVHRKDAAATKTSHDSLVVTMVHGDVLVLENSNFEAHIKRTGTTILLIGESAPPAKHMNKVGIDVGCDGL